MNLTNLQCQLHDSDRRRIELINMLLAFKHWYATSGIHGKQAESLVANAVERLRDHTFNVAFVGEFSRGKTELINALLFEKFHCRLLPSRPGRTTMCPTEIGFNPSLPLNSIQLLPIITRRGGINVRSFKRIPKHWVNLNFDINNPASIQDALGRLAERQFVSEEQARDLGFNCSQLNRHPENIHEVEIPVWRYAIINLEHPLLAQGLRIIDTPGLNALGTDSELSLHSMSEADNLIFCLSADAPVSATDRTIWRDFINAEDNSHSLVVINKIDSLWDDLISSPSEESTINSVRTDTALALGLPLQQVVPVSGKQALLAKARGDRQLLHKSNYNQFESLLTAQLNDRLKMLFKHPDVEDALALIRQTHEQMHKRLLAQAEVLQQVKDLGPEQTALALQTVREALKDEHRKVHQVSILHRSYEREIKHQYETLIGVFSQKQMERILNYLNSAASDPEPILRPAIKATLKQIQLCLRKLAIEAEQTNRILNEIYAQPEGSAKRMRLSSRKLNLHSRQKQYFEFKHRCEQFLHTIEQTAITDRPLIRHFLLNLSQEIRLYITDTNNMIDRWYEHALTPMAYPNECTKQLLQKELLTLSRVGGGSIANSQVLVALRAELTENEDHLYNLNQLLTRIDAFEPIKSTSDKVVPLSFARRKSV
ncbi:dynamin family protein [Halioxenophilus sp. WMMB6]|uniref:dynamin family protein n=1 Tax=Halioxenophilus sp. WMMB6 TaxID=3073815 RepID=UPI00295EB121|nr:dynamin family protein [Halioxenophilus sp. WMMB6]